ncbi:uncharacterized protein [Maniola hyperantus]|uniref:uncharacterized protein n=1 Tax=Aphantopus hyperantus TaxID=2795564 RepID=UPI0015697B90|nr:uncharacterized protein LOC117995980 [Maniola hyperantus]
MAIIENKDLSTNTNKAKINAWNDITEKFNTANIRPRDKRQVLNQWKLIKLSSKKELSIYRQQLIKTGGGPKPPSPTPETLEVIEMIPQEFEIDSNEFDSDGIKDMGTTSASIIEITSEPDYHIDDKDNSTPTIIQISENEPDLNTTNKDIKLNCIEEEDNPAQEKKITSRLFTTPMRVVKKKHPTKNKDSFDLGKSSYEDMHHFRVLENERMQKEHEVRLKNMEEQHSQVMANLTLQNEILKKTLESFQKS